MRFGIISTTSTNNFTQTTIVRDTSIYMTLPQKRVPAEWEAYDTVMVAWPHSATDWNYMLPEITDCYIRIANAIVAESGLRLLVVTPEPHVVAKHLQHLPSERIRMFTCPTNDTWTRDYGPITLIDNNHVCAVDFQFNGWGLKFASNLDNMVNLRMLQAGLLTRNYRSRLNFTFEGGALESDGEGTMLTTAECVLALNRNGFVDEDFIRNYFKSELGFSTVHILHHGALEGDDTDSHIDTLARLAPHHTILYVKSYRPDDSHTASLQAMEQELMQLRTPSGQPYNLIALPLPRPIFDEDGNRLPATYANFLITPRTVILPTYNQPDNDRLASEMLKIAFPDRAIVEVDCSALIRQHGSLHCATMQLCADMLTI